MSHPLESGALSPGTVALLEDVLKRSNAFARSIGRPLDVEALTRYVSGSLPARDAREVEEGLIQQPLERDRLRQVRDCLDELQAMTWAEIEERSHADDFTAMVARVWLTLLTDQISAAGRARDWWGSHAWTTAQQQVAEGLADARAAWSLFVSFTRTLQSALRTPELSLSRGGGKKGGPVVEGDLPAHAEVVVSRSEVSVDGTMLVTIDLQDAAGHTSDALDGKPIHLALTVGGEAWHVVSGIFHRSHLEWKLPGLGSAMGLHAGEFPIRFLHLTVGTLAPEARVGPLPVLADVVDAEGEPTHAPPAIVELTNEPRWMNGQCTLTFAVPVETRSTYANHILRLDMVVSPKRYQHLVACRVSEFGDKELTLTVPCPGCPQASIPYASIVRARLQAPL